MLDLEIIEFKSPTGSATNLYLYQLESDGNDENELSTSIHEHFSKWGLIHSVNISKSDDGTFYSYVRFYSVRSSCKARRENKGEESIVGQRVYFFVSDWIDNNYQ